MATLAKSARRAVRDGEKTVKKTVKKTVAKAEKGVKALATRVSDKVTGRDKKKKAIKRVAAGAAIAGALVVAGRAISKRKRKAR